MSDAPEPLRKVFTLRTEEKFTRTNARPGEDDPAGANDVRAWRADQMDIEHRAGVDELLPPEAPPSNRRRRDLWTLLIANNLFFGSVVYFGQGNPLMLACGTAGMVMGSVGVYWILYHIMSKY